MSSAQTERLNREAAGKQARIEQLESALRALIPWAERAFDGLEYEEEDEREALWESLAGGPDNITPLQRARSILREKPPFDPRHPHQGASDVAIPPPPGPERLDRMPFDVLGSPTKPESEIQRQWREAREEIADSFRKRPKENE